MLSTIGSVTTDETAQAFLSKAAYPTLHGPPWHVEFTGKPCQWDVVLERWAQLVESSEGRCPLVLEEFSEELRLRGCYVHRAHWIGTHKRHSANIC